MGQWLAKWALRLTGWTLTAEPPRQGKYVMVVAPHTSNWDFVVLYLFKVAFAIEATWMGKHTLFNKPILGKFMYASGGVPIDRRQNHNVVSQMVDRFESATNLTLVLAPEGRRRYMSHWRSGFYQIAINAKVPLLPLFLDYRLKQAGFGKPYQLTGNPSTDMDYLRKFFEKKYGKRNQHAGPIQLKDESQSN